jgi:hypothetical protein
MPKPPKGTFPLASLLGGHHYASTEELALIEEEGATALGEGLMKHLCARLAERGIVVGEPDGSSSGGWETDLRLDGARFWLSVGCMGEPTEGWLVSIDEHRNFLGGLLSRSHPREFVRVLTLLHEVLGATKGLAEMRWYDPDDWIKGREAAWHAEPVDAAVSGS